MKRFGGGFVLAMLLLSFSFVSMSPSSSYGYVDPSIGSITIAPGEVKNISYGTVKSGTEMLWDLNISYLGSSLTIWLESPPGLRSSISFKSAAVAGVEGIWNIVFNISGGTESATINYELHLLTPTVHINSPEHRSFLNKLNNLVSGHCSDEKYLGGVYLRLNEGDYNLVNNTNGSWEMEVTFVPGVNDIFVRANYGWGFGSFDYSAWLQVTVDLTPPDGSILTPTENATIRGSSVSISWLSSDNVGIMNQEIQFDTLGWNNVNGYSMYNADLSTGVHSIYLRITDLAGNQVTKNVTISVDADSLSFGGPLYGIPTICIIVAIVLSGIFVIVRFRRHKKSPPIEPET